MTTSPPKPGTLLGMPADLSQQSPEAPAAQGQTEVPVVLRLPRVGLDYSEPEAYGTKSQNVLWGIGLSTGLVLAIMLNLPGSAEVEPSWRWQGAGSSAAAEATPHKTADAFDALRHEPLPTYRAPASSQAGMTGRSAGSMPHSPAHNSGLTSADRHAAGLPQEGSRQSRDLQTATRPLPETRAAAVPGSAQFMNEVIINSNHTPDHERPRSSLY